MTETLLKVHIQKWIPEVLKKTAAFSSIES